MRRVRREGKISIREKSFRGQYISGLGSRDLLPLANNSGSDSLNPADGTYLNEFRILETVNISYTKFREPAIDNIARIHLRKGLHTFTVHTRETGQMNYDFINFQKG
jgi:hypothetical protein